VRFGIVIVAAVVLGVVLAGCAEKPQPIQTVSPSAAPVLVLKVIHPDETDKGIKFNVQPDGNAAIAVECENATRDTVIVFGGHPLPTVYGNSSLLTAEVPAEYYSQPGVIQVSLKGSPGQSGSLLFAVK
jgi:hypothetical protein